MNREIKTIFGIGVAYFLWNVSFVLMGVLFGFEYAVYFGLSWILVFLTIEAIQPTKSFKVTITETESNEPSKTLIGRGSMQYGYKKLEWEDEKEIPMPVRPEGYLDEGSVIGDKIFNFVGYSFPFIFFGITVYTIILFWTQ
jgi:hypothetical protein